MIWLWVLIAIAVLLTIWGLWTLWNTGQRIDRVHRRMIRTRVLLERALVRRASDALALADSDLLPGDSSRALGEAARNSLAAVDQPLATDGLSEDKGDAGGRYVTESQLSHVLRESLDAQSALILERDLFGSQLLERVRSGGYRVAMLRSVHNQDVTLCLDLRSRPDARLFHLAGRAALPEYVDFDDDI